MAPVKQRLLNYGPVDRLASPLPVFIADVLNRIDSGALALPEFQRGYVWSRRQVRDLVQSLYRRHPVGSLLLWETRTEGAVARGDGQLQAGVVSLILDGQQRITSLYGLIRGAPPPFFDGDARAFQDLRFHVESEEFQFYAPVTMHDDPLWVDVGDLMRTDPSRVLGGLMPMLGNDPERFQRYLGRLMKLYGIRDLPIHDETITGEDKTVDVVVDLFNRVNSGGTKLSKGDLALAQIAAGWPEAREELKGCLAKWSAAGYDFSLDWLLRNVNAVVTGRSEFTALTRRPLDAVQQGVRDAERAVDQALNLIASRLGLDNGRVLGAVGALPVLSRYIADRGFRLQDTPEADKLLFWFVHAMMWGRYAGSTETVLNTDLALAAPESDPGRGRARQVGRSPLDGLIGELRRHRGDLSVRAEDFEAWSRGARFYPLLYMLSRSYHARDLVSGIELRGNLLGVHAVLEVHHLFPKALLQRAGYARPERNALANFAFLTLDANRSLGSRPPAEYLPECERRHPGVLASQWIPEDPALWELERYPDFLAARRELLAQAVNALLEELSGGELGPIEEPDLSSPRVQLVDADEEAAELAATQEWLHERGYDAGQRAFVLYGLDGGAQEAVLDLAWPDGLRYGGERVALLLDEPTGVRDAAVRHGFRYFTSVAELQAHAGEIEEPSAA